MAHKPTKKQLASLSGYLEDRSQEIQKYKKIAADRAKGNRYGQEYAIILRDNLISYIEGQQEKRQPVTIAGIIRASGMGHDTFYRYKNGEADYKLYKYMEDNNIAIDLEGTEYTGKDGVLVLLCPMSDIIKSALACVQEQLETNCYTNKGNPAGSIFGLKAAFGWQDQPTETRTSNTLVINNVATLEEAREAIKRLNG